MKIGVSGASGHLGKAVVSELLLRSGGHEVVAITRTPETVAGPAQARFRRLQPARKSSGGLCGSRSSSHHHDRRPGARKARSAERRCHRRGREGGRQACRLHVRRRHAVGGRAGAWRVLLAGRAASDRHGASLDHSAYELLCRSLCAASASGATPRRARRARREPRCFRCARRRGGRRSRNS